MQEAASMSEKCRCPITLRGGEIWARNKAAETDNGRGRRAKPVRIGKATVDVLKDTELT